MPISFIGALIGAGVTSVNQYGASTTLNPPIHGSAAADDLMLCIAAIREDGADAEDVASFPGGWVEIAGVDARHASATNNRLAAAWKIHDGSETDPVVQFNAITGAGAGDTTMAIIAVFRGTHLTDPIDVVGSISGNASAIDIGPISSITPSVNDACVVVIGHGGTADTVGGDNGMDPLADYSEAMDLGSTAGSDACLSVQYRILSGAPSATGDKTIVTNNTIASTGIGIMFSIKPPSVVVSQDVLSMQQHVFGHNVW